LPVSTLKINEDLSHAFPLKQAEVLSGHIAQAADILVNSSRIYQ